MDKARETLKLNLKRLRHRERLTQAALAELVDVSLRGYQKYEQGEAWPEPKILARLADQLNEPIAGLFLGKDEEPKLSIPASPGGVGEAIQLLSAFEALSAGLKIAVLTLIHDDERYLAVLRDPGRRSRASGKLDELREVFEP